jgi:uncharacterized MAPEG superfamily protein
MNIRVLIILLICGLSTLKAQELHGKYLGTQHGLLSNECYDINYSEEGYLIVGTQYGPMKFDGEKFIPICLNLPIERRIIYDFEKDPSGRIYMFNSKNELLILKKDLAVRITLEHSKPLPNHIHFKKLHWSPKGLTIFTNNTYVRYFFNDHKLLLSSYTTKAKKNVFIYDPSKEFPIEKHISEEITIPDHTILFKHPHQKLVVNERVNSDSREDFVKVGESTYALISSQLYRISSVIEQLPYKHILFIEFFHDRLWLATDYGLVELDKNGKWIQTHFKGQIIGGVAPLNKQGIAVSLNKYGIFICSNIHERFYKGIFPTQVSSHDKTMIIGNELGQLFHFQNNRLTKIHDAITWSKDTRKNFLKIRHIEYIKDKWYICTIRGIYSLDPDLKKRKRLMFSESYSFNDFFISKGKIYSLGWSAIGTFRKNEKHITTPLIRCRYILNDSVVLIGSEEGLFEFHVPTRKLVRSRLFKHPYYVTHIQELSKNEFLISSRYKGIFHFKNGRLFRKYKVPFISLKKALISNRQIFAAGNQGIYVKSLDYENDSPWTKIFDQEIQNMFLIKEQLFICATEDLIVKDIRSEYKIGKPAVILHEILLGDEKKSKLPKQIDYNVPISLDFDILHFNSTKLRLYYRLNGAVKISKLTEGTRLNFDALPSGNYQLELYPVIDGKIQASNSKKYCFRIKEPFWESTLFYVLISIVVLLVLWSFRLVRNLKRKKVAAERAELESKLNEYKLLAVKAQVNPHFLSNGFAAIQALILKGNNDYAAQYLAKFSFLMRKILYYSETQFITVDQELQLMDAYLELELLRSNNRFQIHKEILLSETQLKTFKIPSLLLQPILENAIWHGLKFRKNNPKIIISFLLNDQQKLRIQISDNGPGFNTTNKTEEHLSKGNKLITERIETLNKQFKQSVADMDIATSGSGTHVIFTFSAELYQFQ